VRSDLEIYLEFARRMDFRDRDGAPLVKWHDPESAFEAFKLITAGRPCDYTGLTYAKLTGGSGVQWPCNAENPDGRERLYADGVFNTFPEYCEIYGNDLETGSELTEQQFRAMNPNGRAILKAARYHPPKEEPDEEYPLMLTTGRLVHHFHTRTKTGRSRRLQDAAPAVFLQISAADAAAHGIEDGDLVEVESRRGKVRAPARVGDVEAGVVFLPFHYGSWDREPGRPDDPDHPTAANELTITAWDAVSKQPHFKYAAVRVRRVGGAS
jgi:anaerobic selenocysteine-containing dehydrogenase